MCRAVLRTTAVKALHLMLSLKLVGRPSWPGLSVSQKRDFSWLNKGVKKKKKFYRYGDEEINGLIK